MLKYENNDNIFKGKKILNKHYYISPKKMKFHGFNFLITNIKNFGMKRDKITINRLLNSSKYMLRDNLNYKSCFDLSRNIHYYPYKPECSSSNSEKRKNPGFSSAGNKKKISSKLLFKNNSINNYKCNTKYDILSRKKLTTPISPISNYKKITPMNKYSADSINFNCDFKKIHKDFINNYNLIKKKNDYDIQFLINSLNNISLDKNLFNNNEHLAKISSLKFDSLTIKLKLSGLSLKFYELKKKRKKNFINITNFNENKISTIKFPFEFIYFFYGLNFDSFLVFLTNIIEYNYSNNSFEINYDNFNDNYNLYKSTFSFYNFDSFIEKYNHQNIKEYFKFNWDINIENEDKREKKKIKNCLLKILLPKMSISIQNNINKKSKFYANIEYSQLCHFLKNNFLNWDKYILNYFSEFKLFRYVRNNLLSADKNFFPHNDNDINNFKDLKKVRYNLNRTNIILNNIKTNNKSYIFFFTTYKSEEKNKKNNYFLQITLPKIYVNYRDNNSSINKEFDIDIKTMTKLNKLRKSFNPKDIIKYCLLFIKGKNHNRFSKNGSVKKINSNFEKINKQNSGKYLSKFSIKNNQIENISQLGRNADNLNEDIIDIKLNLDENIFNFDEDILKYIKVDDEEKKNNKINQNKEHNKLEVYSTIHLNDKNYFEDNKDKKLNIEIDKIQLNWIINNNDKNVYKFDDDEREYLFDHSSIIWRKYIEKNFAKIIEASIPENKLLPPSLKNSNSTIKLTRTYK